MQYEITVEGPVFALLRLHHDLRRFSPVMEKIQQKSSHKEERGTISFVEPNDSLFDEKLREVYRIITNVENAFSLDTKFDIRVRNLAYSEPSTGSTQFTEPFYPIASITIQPWGPPVSRLKDSQTIILDPHHAFGSGKHPSTQLCLRIMELLAKDTSRAWKLEGARVLDFGSGTGLLAMAAIKMGARSVLGVEIDEQSAQEAKRNVLLNYLSQRIEIKKGSWEVVQGKYDLILANLVPSALIRTGKNIPVHMENRGLAVVAGFGENQLDEMKRFFKTTGLIISQQLTLKRWAALIMTKKEKKSTTYPTLCDK